MVKVHVHSCGCVLRVEEGDGKLTRPVLATGQAADTVIEEPKGVLYNNYTSLPRVRLPIFNRIVCY